MENKFTENLNALIQNDQRTAAAIAEAAGIGASYLSQMRKGGKTAPSMEVVISLARALNVPLEKLTGGGDVNFTNGKSERHADPSILQEDPVPYRVQARDELLTEENIALLGRVNARMLLDKMFDKAKADLAYYQRNARAINHLVDYLKTNPE